MGQLREEDDNLLQKLQHELRKSHQQRENEIEIGLEQPPNSQETEPMPEILFIADSNRKTIAPYLIENLKDHKIITEEEVYTTKDILPRKDLHDKTNNTTTIIMLGTNDIRLGRTDQAIINIEKLAKKIKQENTFAVLVPPMELPQITEDEQDEIELQILRYSKAIKNTFQNHIKLTKLTKENKTNPIMQKDGFHLNEIGGSIVAQIITDAIKMQMTLDTSSDNDNHTTEINQPPGNSQQPERHEEDVQYLVVNSDTVGHIIGKKGKRITEIKQRHKVKISTGETRTNQEIVLTIEGPRNSRQNAIQEINTIICEQNEKNNSRSKNTQRKHPLPILLTGSM
jgi:predicted RNA-binding protein YlqC (UPF0109 family)